MILSLEKALAHSKAGMLAESVRLNTVASNIASANAESTNAEGAYKAKKVVFSRVMNRTTGIMELKAVGIQESQAQHKVRFDPGHPMADENGYVYGSNVNTIEEMTDMQSATKSYETNALVVGSIKQMMNKTLQLGK